MGRRSKSGGVTAKGNRIQFDILHQGKRYRPTVEIEPSQANLQRARRRHAEIVRKIAAGTFNFADEFPGYKFADKLAPQTSPTFRQVAEDYLASVANDLEHSTIVGYRKTLEATWFKEFGAKVFKTIKFTDIQKYIGATPWATVKYRNNVLSVGKRVFDYGYGDFPEMHNPIEKVKTARRQKEPPDPFTLKEAEKIIAAMREEWGEWYGDFYEFQFFAGLRSSEAIALPWTNYDRNNGVVRVRCARVYGQSKDRTKTSVVRDVELCARAWNVIERQRAKSLLHPSGLIFPINTKEQMHDLRKAQRRWKRTLLRLGIRHRPQKNTRHTHISWNLMIGKNPVWVADQHGHSVQTMIDSYAKWLKGTTEKDIKAIVLAMEFGTNLPLIQRKQKQDA